MLGKYFNTIELTGSITAIRKGIINKPNTEQLANLRLLVEKVLDPVREMWGRPILVNSGFRSKELNIAVGGAANSQHTKGMAADIDAGCVAANRALIKLIKKACAEGRIEYDQLICEKGCEWIHISYNQSFNRKQFLKL